MTAESRPRGYLSTADRPSVAVYARVAQDDGERSWDAIREQQQLCAAAATRLGAHVVGGFVDIGQPGDRTDRPGLNHLLAYAEVEPVDYVAIARTDRLATRPRQFNYLLLRLHKLGSNILFADTDTVLELVLPSDIEVRRGHQP